MLCQIEGSVKLKVYILENVNFNCSDRPYTNQWFKNKRRTYKFFEIFNLHRLTVYRGTACTVRSLFFKCLHGTGQIKILSLSQCIMVVVLFRTVENTPLDKSSKAFALFLLFSRWIEEKIAIWRIVNFMKPIIVNRSIHGLEVQQNSLFYVFVHAVCDFHAHWTHCIFCIMKQSCNSNIWI